MMSVEKNGQVRAGELKIEWTEWQRTFLFLPRKTITGTVIIGPAWCRMQKDHRYEFKNDVGYYISQGLGFIEYDGFIEYATKKKDIFLRRLTGEE